MTTTAVREQLTLLELARRTNLSTIVTIAEVLNETNDWLEDAVWLESNQPTSHITTQRTSLPAGTFRKIWGGVSREASSTRQIVEGMCMLEAYSVVDKFLVDIAPDKGAFRSGEDRAFIEGMGQTFSNCMFTCTLLAPYGDIVGHPERFNGFPKRLDDVTRGNVLDNGDTGTNDTSIYIVQWGENMVHMTYPKGSTAGIKHTDLGEQTVTAVDTTATAPSEFQAYRSHFELRAGLVVRDERCVQRIASIDSVHGQTYSFNDDNLIRALNNMPYNGKGAKIYCNKTIKTQIDILVKDKMNVNYGPADAFGVPTTLFRGVRVRQVDAISNGETQL